MPKITNKNYRKFLDKGIIDIITLEKLNKALANIKGKHIKEARALLICLYYTGARPIEVLGLKGRAFKRVDSYVTIEVQAVKRGLNRTIFLPYRYKLVKEMYDYAVRCFPNAMLFYHFRSSYKRRVVKKDGSVTYREEVTDKLRYFFKRWFTGVIKDSITPYFLRHNRFSQLSEAGLTPQDIQHIKGAKSANSVQPYLHLSTKSAKNIAKKIK